MNLLQRIFGTRKKHGILPGSEQVERHTFSDNSVIENYSDPSPFYAADDNNINQNTEAFGGGDFGGAGAGSDYSDDTANTDNSNQDDYSNDSYDSGMDSDSSSDGGGDSGGGDGGGD